MDLKYIDRVSNLSKKRFIQEYYKPQRPVIIQDAIAQWPAYERWNFDYIRNVAGHKTVPLYDDRPVDHKDGFNEPHATMKTEVFPAAFNPVAPLSAYKPLFAKYVKQFNHSILVPLVTVNASTPGVIKVTLWNKHPASLDAAFAILPSSLAPPPASP